MSVVANDIIFLPRESFRPREGLTTGVPSPVASLDLVKQTGHPLDGSSFKAYDHTAKWQARNNEKNAKYRKLLGGLRHDASSSSQLRQCSQLTSVTQVAPPLGQVRSGEHRPRHSVPAPSKHTVTSISSLILNSERPQQQRRWSSGQTPLSVLHSPEAGNTTAVSQRRRHRLSLHLAHAPAQSDVTGGRDAVPDVTRVSVGPAHAARGSAPAARPGRDHQATAAQKIVKNIKNERERRTQPPAESVVSGGDSPVPPPRRRRSSGRLAGSVGELVDADADGHGARLTPAAVRREAGQCRSAATAVRPESSQSAAPSGARRPGDLPSPDSSRGPASSHVASSDSTSRGPASSYIASPDSSRGPAYSDTRSSDFSLGPVFGDVRSPDSSLGPVFSDVRSPDSSLGPAFGDFRSPDSSLGPAFGDDRSPDSGRGRVVSDVRTPDSSLGPLYSDARTPDSSLGPYLRDASSPDSSLPPFFSECDSVVSVSSRVPAKPRGQSRSTGDLLTDSESTRALSRASQRSLKFSIGQPLARAGYSTSGLHTSVQLNSGEQSAEPRPPSRDCLSRASTVISIRPDDSEPAGRRPRRAERSWSRTRIGPERRPSPCRGPAAAPVAPQPGRAGDAAETAESGVGPARRESSPADCSTPAHEPSRPASQVSAVASVCSGVASDSPSLALLEERRSRSETRLRYLGSLLDVESADEPSSPTAGKAQFVKNASAERRRATNSAFNARRTIEHRRGQQQQQHQQQEQRSRSEPRRKDTWVTGKINVSVTSIDRAQSLTELAAAPPSACLTTSDRSSSSPTLESERRDIRSYLYSSNLTSSGSGSDRERRRSDGFLQIRPRSREGIDEFSERRKTYGFERALGWNSSPTASCAPPASPAPSPVTPTDAAMRHDAGNVTDILSVSEKRSASGPLLLRTTVVTLGATDAETARPAARPHTPPPKSRSITALMQDPDQPNWIRLAKERRSLREKRDSRLREGQRHGVPLTPEWRDVQLRSVQSTRPRQPSPARDACPREPPWMRELKARRCGSLSSSLPSLGSGSGSASKRGSTDEQAGAERLPFGATLLSTSPVASQQPPAESPVVAGTSANRSPQPPAQSAARPWQAPPRVARPLISPTPTDTALGADTQRQAASCSTLSAEAELLPTGTCTFSAEAKRPPTVSSIPSAEMKRPSPAPTFSSSDPRWPPATSPVPRDTGWRSASRRTSPDRVPVAPPDAPAPSTLHTAMPHVVRVVTSRNDAAAATAHSRSESAGTRGGHTGVYLNGAQPTDERTKTSFSINLGGGPRPSAPIPPPLPRQPPPLTRQKPPAPARTLSHPSPPPQQRKPPPPQRKPSPPQRKPPSPPPPRKPSPPPLQRKPSPPPPLRKPSPPPQRKPSPSPQRQPSPPPSRPAESEPSDSGSLFGRLESEWERMRQRHRAFLRDTHLDMRRRLDDDRYQPLRSILKKHSAPSLLESVADDDKPEWVSSAEQRRRRANVNWEDLEHTKQQIKSEINRLKSRIQSEFGGGPSEGPASARFGGRSPRAAGHTSSRTTASHGCTVVETIHAIHIERDTSPGLVITEVTDDDAASDHSGVVIEEVLDDEPDPVRPSSAGRLGSPSPPQPQPQPAAPCPPPDLLRTVPAAVAQPERLADVITFEAEPWFKRVPASPRPSRAAEAASAPSAPASPPPGPARWRSAARAAPRSPKLRSSSTPSWLRSPDLSSGHSKATGDPPSGYSRIVEGTPQSLSGHIGPAAAAGVAASVRSTIIVPDIQTAPAPAAAAAGADHSADVATDSGLLTRGRRLVTLEWEESTSSPLAGQQDVLDDSTSQASSRRPRHIHQVHANVSDRDMQPTKFGKSETGASPITLRRVLDANSDTQHPRAGPASSAPEPAASVPQQARPPSAPAGPGERSGAGGRRRPASPSPVRRRQVPDPAQPSGPSPAHQQRSGHSEDQCELDRPAADQRELDRQAEQRELDRSKDEHKLDCPKSQQELDHAENQPDLVPPREQEQPERSILSAPEQPRRQSPDIDSAECHSPKHQSLGHHSPERHSPERHSPERHAPERHSPEYHSTEHHLPGRHSPEHHSPECHSTERHLPERRSPEHHSPERHSPERHSPEHHSPERHSPEHHSPEQRSPEHHSPERHSPERHSPERHSPERHSPEHHSPEHHSPEHHSPQRHSPERHSPEHHSPQRRPPERQEHRSRPSSSPETFGSWKARHVDRSARAQPARDIGEAIGLRVESALERLLSESGGRLAASSPRLTRADRATQVSGRPATSASGQQQHAVRSRHDTRVTRAARTAAAHEAGNESRQGGAGRQAGGRHTHDPHAAATEERNARKSESSTCKSARPDERSEQRSADTRTRPAGSTDRSARQDVLGGRMIIRHKLKTDSPHFRSETVVQEAANSSRQARKTTGGAAAGVPRRLESAVGDGQWHGTARVAAGSRHRVLTTHTANGRLHTTAAVTSDGAFRAPRTTKEVHGHKVTSEQRSNGARSSKVIKATATTTMVGRRLV